MGIILYVYSCEYDCYHVVVIFRWRDKCPWAPIWWVCKDQHTAAPALPLTFPPCTQKPNWWVYTCIHMDTYTFMHTHTQVHTLKLKVLQLSFPLSYASKAVLLGLCGFHHLVCNQSSVWTCQCSTGDSGWNKGPFMWLWLGCPPTAWCIS